MLYYITCVLYTINSTVIRDFYVERCRNEANLVNAHVFSLCILIALSWITRLSERECDGYILTFSFVNIVILQIDIRKCLQLFLYVDLLLDFICEPVISRNFINRGKLFCSLSFSGKFPVWHVYKIHSKRGSDLVMQESFSCTNIIYANSM